MGEEKPGLEIWVVYDHPSDMPDFYVARKQIAMAGQVLNTSAIMVSHDLASLRAALAEMDLACLARDPGDDPVIIESWL